MKPLFLLTVLPPLIIGVFISYAAVMTLVVSNIFELPIYASLIIVLASTYHSGKILLNVYSDYFEKNKTFNKKV